MTSATTTVALRTIWACPPPAARLYSPRRAAQNLDRLLRQVYLFQSGVMDRGPSEGDFGFMLSELRQGADALKAKLRKLA
jgi:hypothetical protein